MLDQSLKRALGFGCRQRECATSWWEYFYARISFWQELSSRHEHYQDFAPGRILGSILVSTDLFLSEILTEMCGWNFSREGSCRENGPPRQDPSGIPVSGGNLGEIPAGSRYLFYKG